MRNLPGEVTVNVSVKQSPISGPSVDVQTFHKKKIIRGKREEGRSYRGASGGTAGERLGDVELSEVEP